MQDRDLSQNLKEEDNHTLMAPNGDCFGEGIDTKWGLVEGRYRNKEKDYTMGVDMVRNLKEDKELSLGEGGKVSLDKEQNWGEGDKELHWD